MADPETNIYAVKEVEWKEAIKAEMEAIKRNSTCYLTKLPEGKKAIGLKWIYKTKQHSNGRIVN